MQQRNCCKISLLFVYVKVAAFHANACALLKFYELTGFVENIWGYLSRLFNRHTASNGSFNYNDINRFKKLFNSVHKIPETPKENLCRPMRKNRQFDCFLFSSLSNVWEKAC